jgi:mannose/fructose/N-acetylgalactosamine-specific phosphotransferase system component IID
VNILLFHLLISHPGFQGGIIATLLWFLVFNAHRTAFAGVFQAKA